MSSIYSYHIFLAIPLEPLVIRKIIEKGKEKGFVFLNPQKYGNTSMVFLAPTTSTVAQQHAITFLFNKKNDPFENFPGLCIQYDTTYFIITLHENEKHTHIQLVPSNHTWKKKYKEKSYDDLGRYLSLLIDLCEPFPVLKIETCYD